jgi:uncharacterized protein (UPF0335 family)
MADATRVAREQLLQLVERIEKLEEEKTSAADHIKAVYAEAKAAGYDTGTIRKVVALRRQDSASRQEEATLLDLYLAALGMLPASEEA